MLVRHKFSIILFVLICLIQVTARAVWQPRLEIEDDWEAFRSLLLSSVLSPSVFKETSESLVDAIIALAKSQVEVMILGEVDGKSSPNLKKLSGHAYMSGTGAQYNFL